MTFKIKTGLQVGSALVVDENGKLTTGLSTARTISLTGDVTGSVAFDGTSDVSITAVVADDSHSHSNYLTGESDTLATVTARGASTSTASTFSGGLYSRKSQTTGNYTTAALWTESYDNTPTGVAFHISGVVGKFLEMRTDGTLYWNSDTVWHSGNLTNLNQLTNGPGYITGESDTLATVTARGASTSTASTFSGGLTASAGLTVSGSNSPSSPIIAITPTGSGAFQRGVRMLNSGMSAGDSLMYAVGQADNSKNMGQFYFSFAGSGSNSNRLSLGLHSVDDVLNLFGSGNIQIGSTTDAGYKLGVTGTFATTSNARLGGGTSNPASTAFSHTIAGVATNRVVNFDGNTGFPSVWWSTGSRAYGAIDAKDPGLTFWANDGSSWQQQFEINYGNVTVNTDIRSPIFYDSNNTGYYADPNGTSNFNALTTNGRTILGGHIYVSSTNTNTLNSGYGVAANTADIWLNYRGYNDGQDYYRNFNVGDGRGTNIIWASGPNRTVTINNGQTFTYSIMDNTPVVGSATNNKLEVNGSIQLTGDNDAIVFGRATASFLKDEELGFGWGGGWYMTDDTYLRVRGSKILYNNYIIRSDTDVRAPIFYDNNDTGYYIDPSSTSDAALRMHGGALFGANSTWGAYLYVGTNGRVGTSATVAVTDGNLHLDSQNGHQLYLNWYSTENTYTHGYMGVGSDSALYRLHVHGTGYATSDFRAPIFYDSDDTGYYLDPHNWSYINKLRTNYPIYRHFQVYGNSSNNLARTWSGYLVSGSDSGGAESYTIIETTVPQDAYMMGGFTLELFENYSSNNGKTTIELSGYWNPEYNGGFVGWMYTSSNPNINPTIQVGRNSSGNTVFVISHWASDYNIYSAKDLWLGYSSGADSYGIGWTMRQASSISDITNLDTVVPRSVSSGLLVPITRGAAGAGYLSGNYSSGETTATTGAIYTIGGNYYPTANSLNNMYGIGYAYASVAGGAAGATSGSSWGLYVATNGTTRVFLDSDNGRVLASGDMRAPIYYDYNDTTYYADPGSTSSMNQINMTGGLYMTGGDWVRMYGQVGIYSQSYGQHLYPASSGAYWNISAGGNSYGGFRARDSHEGTVKTYFGYWDVNGFGILDNSGNWNVRGNYGGGNTGGQLYGPWIVDQSVSNGSTSTPALNIRKGWSDLPQVAYDTVHVQSNDVTSIRLGEADGTTAGWSSGDSFTTFTSTHPIRFFSNGSATAAIYNGMGGSLGLYITSGSARSPIFYDYDDTAYRIDGNGTSYLNKLSVKTLLIEGSNSAFNNAIERTYWCSASATQAQRHEIARIGIDQVNWNNVGSFEIELSETYYSSGCVKKYNVTYGNTATNGAVYLTEFTGEGSNNFQVSVGSKVLVTGNQYYLPVYVDVRYYTQVVAKVKTTRTITNSSIPAIGYTYLFDSPTVSNIADFTADSTITTRGGLYTPTMWVNYSTENYNNYNENIRLFPAGNGVSVIAFGASGSGGSPWNSILGYSDRFEVRQGNQWQQRNYADYVEAYGSFRAPIFYDSNDTGYYCDPTSNSNLYKVTGYQGAKYQSTDWADAFRNTPVSGRAFHGDVSSGGPQGTWWFYDSMRHSNASNYWGTQIAYGWEDNSNEIWQRNISGNSFSSWVRYLNSNNYSNYAVKINDWHGNLYHHTDGRIYSTIYYDANDSGYYVDANNTSRQYQINFNNLYYAPDTNYGFIGTSIYVDTINSGYSGDQLEINHVRGTWAGISHDSLRAPLYYDYNDTNYYLDPNGTSRINWINADGLRSYTNIYIDGNYGYGIIGTYSSYRYQGVFAMGDSYKLPVDGTTTGNLYGLAWSHPNAGGVASNLNTHGLLAMENGTWLASLSGSVRARDDMRAPIFYDNNDTGYYCDPNGTNRLNFVNSNNHYIQPGYMLYSDHGGWTGENNKIQWHSNNLYLQNAGGGYLLVLRRGDGGERFYCDYDGNVTASGNITAYSDARLKKNVKTITNPIDIVKQLRGVTFDWIESGEHSYGLIAQEVEKVIPELVMEGTNGTAECDEAISIKSVDYSKMVSVLIEAIKEQQAQIDELRRFIK